jgi:hypothetical protein
VQAPDQPANALPALGVALSVTALPGLKFAVQTWPQLMPAGLLLIVPAPEPVNCTVSWFWAAEEEFPELTPPQPNKKISSKNDRITTNRFPGKDMAVEPHNKFDAG